ncbi:MAG: type I methionyl aminopeptidase [Armatimonadetes bacterium]|nr:type I methionyl aminopeptidase [Armatimonadota bacterium]
MAASLKTPAEIDRMRVAGHVAARALARVLAAVAPDVTTLDLDAIAEHEIRAMGGAPSFKGYHGFTGSICASVNDEIVHGIPGPRLLKEGDVVSVDLGAYVEGFHGDVAATVAVGEIHSTLRRLLAVTEASLRRAIDTVRPDATLGDLGQAVQAYVEAEGFTVVRDYAGHGLGRNLHEEPQVPNFGRRGQGLVMRPGMVFAIEPMVNVGTWRAMIDPDGWTVRTADRKASAHFEHTVAVTESGHEVLTELESDGILQ